MHGLVAAVKPVQEERSIVLLGSFNPSIFQPAWLAAEGLIRKTEAESAKPLVIHAELSQLEFDGYDLLVTTDRFQLKTQLRPNFPVIRDLCLGIFGILSHTPLRALGINSEAVFDLGTRERRHAFGHALAPKPKFWAPVMEDPLLAGITVLSGRPSPRGDIRVRVNPEPGGADSKVRIHINDEYVRLDGLKATPGSRAVLSALEESWNDADEFAKRLFEHLMTEAQTL